MTFFATNAAKIAVYAILLIPIITLFMMIYFFIGNNTHAAAQFFRYKYVALTVIFGLFALMMALYTIYVVTIDPNKPADEQNLRFDVIAISVLTILALIFGYSANLSFKRSDKTVSTLQYSSTALSSMKIFS